MTLFPALAGARHAAGVDRDCAVFPQPRLDERNQSGFELVRLQTSHPAVGFKLGDWNSVLVDGISPQFGGAPVDPDPTGLMKCHVMPPG